MFLKEHKNKNKNNAKMKKSHRYFAACKNYVMLPVKTSN